MKAMIYEGIKKIRYENKTDPILENTEDIIIKVTSTAICGSDLHIYHGLIPHVKKGTAIGHESMGIVEEVGKDVVKVKKGDRVLIPFPVSCGHCAYCAEGFTSQCDNSNDYGAAGGLFGYGQNYGGYDGGQAEYLRVPYANFGPRVVPESLIDEDVLFATDILPTSLWAVESAGVKGGDTVVVLGCGPVGQLAVKWAWLKGAERVIAVDCIDYRLEHAYQHNKAEIINFEKYKETGNYVKEITKGGADCVIDCVGFESKMNLAEMAETALKLQGGSQSALTMASQMVRKEGTVMLAGVYGTRYNAFPLGDFFARNITLKMGQCPAHTYVDEVMTHIINGTMDAKHIISHTLPLALGEEAYELFDKKKDNCLKVVLKP